MVYNKIALVFVHHRVRGYSMWIRITFVQLSIHLFTYLMYLGFFMAFGVVFFLFLSG